MYTRISFSLTSVFTLQLLRRRGRGGRLQIQWRGEKTTENKKVRPIGDGCVYTVLYRDGVFFLELHGRRKLGRAQENFSFSMKWIEGEFTSSSQGRREITARKKMRQNALSIGDSDDDSSMSELPIGLQPKWVLW